MNDRILSEANVDYVLSKMSPKEYTQLEYVECDGNQYAITDYYANNLTEISAGIALLDRTVTSTVFSSRNDTDPPTKSVSLFFIANSNFRMDWNNIQHALSPNNTGAVAIRVNKNTTRIQDLSYTFENANFTATGYPLWIFASRYNGTITNYAKIRLYYLSISENGALLKYFIPCKYNSKIGLYDIISGDFLTSKTSTEFIAGPEVGAFHIPENYRLTEYIDRGSAGNYVDTNIKLNGSSRIVARTVKLGTAAAGTAIYGGRAGASESFGRSLMNLYTNNSWRFDYGSSKTTITGINYDRDLYVDFDAGKSMPSLIFSHYTKTFQKQTFDSPSNFLILAVGQGTNSSPMYGVNGRVYFMRLYKDGVLVRNLWPVVRKTDNKSGLFDVANQIFYSSAGSSDFTYDSNKTVDVFDNSGNNYLIQNGSAQKPATVDYVLKAFNGEPIGDARPFSVSNLQYLMAPYIKLDYIESSGTQYLLTNFFPNQDTRIVCTATMVNVSETSETNGGILYGSGDSHNSKAFEFFTAQNKYEIDYDGQYNFSTKNATINEKIIVDQNKNITTLTYGDGTIETVIFNSASFTCPYDLMIFGLHRATIYRGITRIHDFKIYSNDLLIKSLIPAKRKKDGVLGMYDEINGIFLTNKGTGEFIAGPKL